MSRRIFVIVAVLFTLVFAENEALWSHSMISRVNFSQTAYGQWAAGGINSLSFNALNDANLKYVKDALIWDSKLQLAFGVSRLGTAPFVKSDDKIDFTSDLASTLNEFWSAGGKLNFRSQFAPGYDSDTVRVSSFLAPAYASVSAGMNYTRGDLKLTLSPLAGKFTFVTDPDVDESKYGLTAGSTFKAEAGGSAALDYRHELLENITTAVHVDIFSNYLDQPWKIDVNSQFLVDMTVNKYIGLNFRLDLVYDDDILFDIDGTQKAAWQLQEMFGFGLTYKLDVK